MSENLKIRVLSTVWRLTSRDYYDVAPNNRIVQALAGEFGEAAIKEEITRLYLSRYLVVRGGTPHSDNMALDGWNFRLQQGLCPCGELFNERGLREHQETCAVYRACVQELENPVPRTELPVPVAPVASPAPAPAARGLTIPMEQILLEIAFEHPCGIGREELVTEAYARKLVAEATIKGIVTHLLKRGALNAGEDGLLKFSLEHWCTCGEDYGDYSKLEKHRATCRAWNRLMKRADKG
jgi:hypothetical protein